MKENILEYLQSHFIEDKVYYTSHAKNEMEFEELGRIFDNEIYESIVTGEIIEKYMDDKPYPSYLVNGTTKSGRPLHSVCAINEIDDVVIVITAYHPNPNRWIDFRRRKGK